MRKKKRKRTNIWMEKNEERRKNKILMAVFDYQTSVGLIGAS